MYQPVPSVTIPPGQPLDKFSKTAKSQPPGQISWSNPRAPGFSGTLNFNKFYTFSPFSTPRSLPIEYLQISGGKLRELEAPWLRK